LTRADSCESHGPRSTTTHLTPTTFPRPDGVSTRAQLEVSAPWTGLLGDGPEDRIDIGNIDNPRGIDGNRQPGRAGNDSKKDKWLEQDPRIQSAQEGEGRDKWQAVHPAPDRKDHDCHRSGSHAEGGAWHQAKSEECGTYENGGGHDGQCGPENTK